MAAPPPPAQPVATDQAGSGGANPPLGPTPYQVTNTGITRLPVPILNMPQTVNVIPQAIIQEQNATTIEQALQYIPGITFSAGEGAQQGDGPIIRGFVARGDLFRDGIRDPGWYTRDAFSIDRIEVYKGPSAFAFGRGATGGAINYVTRLPTGANYLESTSTVMTGNGYREVVDASGKSGNVSGRIQGLFQDVNTPTRDQIWTKRWGVAPSMVYDFQQGTKATLYYIYQGEEGVSDYGFTYLPQPAFSPLTGLRPVPAITAAAGRRLRSRFPAPTSSGSRADRSAISRTTDTHIITEKIEHEFDKDLKLSNATRYIDNERFARVTAPRNVGLANNNFPGRGSPHGLGWNHVSVQLSGGPVDLWSRAARARDRQHLSHQSDRPRRQVHHRHRGTPDVGGARGRTRDAPPGPARSLRLDQRCLPHQCVQSRSQRLSGRRRHHQLPSDRDQGGGLCRLCVRPGQDHQVFRAARVVALRLLRHRL